MLLAVDIGNTSITLGAYKNDELAFTARLMTDREKNGDGYEKELLGILDSHSVRSEEFEGTIISSVVPEITESFSLAVKNITGKEPMLVGEKHNGNL